MNDQISSQNDQIDTQKYPQILIYLRKTNKFAIKIYIPSPIQLSMLAGIIQTQTIIPKEHLIFFHQGNAYPGQQGQDLCDAILKIKPNSIIHIRDARNMKKGIISIIIQIINSSNTKGQAKVYSVNSQTNIGSFLSHISQVNVNRENIFLLESGRKLKLSTTFYQQSIEDNTTIYLIIKNQEIQNKIKLKDYLTNQKNNRLELDTPIPNFKKKNKSVCMITDITTSSQVFKWQHDHNQDLNVKKLATSLKWKKVQNQVKDRQSKKKLTPSGKSRLRQQFQKLFQYDSTGINVKNQQQDEEPCLNIFQQDQKNKQEITTNYLKEKQNKNHKKLNGFSREDI